MYRRSRFLVGLAAAAITFGSLCFTMGSEHFNRGCRPCHKIENCGMNNDHYRHCNESTKGINAEKVIIIREVVKTDSVKK